MAGATAIAGGASSLRSALETIIVPGHTNQGLDGIYFKAVGEVLSNSPRYDFIPDRYFQYIADPANMQMLNRLDWLNFFCGMAIDVGDRLYGRTVTWTDLRNYYEGRVITGLNKNISTNEATLKGYVSPNIIISQKDGSLLDNEYGIIVVSASPNTIVNDHHILKIDNGYGGEFELSFNNLSPSTKYSYKTYFKDKTNNIFIVGEEKYFETKNDDNDLRIIYDNNWEDEYKKSEIIVDPYGGYFSLHLESPGTGGEFPIFYLGFVIPGLDLNNFDNIKLVWEKIFDHTLQIKYSIYKSEDDTEVYQGDTFGYYFGISENTKLKYMIFIEPNVFLKEPGDYYIKASLKWDDKEYFASKNFRYLCPSTEDYVDLGLSVKWARCNWGASKPEDEGLRIHYPETELKGLRIPSVNEFKELFEKCECRMVSYNGSDGILFANKETCKSIFIPSKVRDQFNEYYLNYTLSHGDSHPSYSIDWRIEPTGRSNNNDIRVTRLVE